MVAINFLADALVGANLWDKFIAVYPFVGRSANSNSFNLIDVNKYRITWYGSVIHNFSGVVGNGGYGNTGILIGNFDPLNIHLSAYNGTRLQNANSGGRLIGHHSSVSFKFLKDTAAQELNLNNGNQKLVGYVYGELGLLSAYGYELSDAIANNISALGLMVGNNSSECYLNNQLFGRDFGLQHDRIYKECDKPIILLGNRFFGGVLSGSNANIRFASIGFGFLRHEIQLLTEIVSEYQTILYRNALG